MDLRNYYKKLRDVESGLTGEYLVVASLETSEGGKEGVLTETPRPVAARLIAEGRARVATKEESKAFRDSIKAAKKQYEREEAANRVQVVVIPSNDLTDSERS